jgi:hypothetical protein
VSLVARFAVVVMVAVFAANLLLGLVQGAWSRGSAGPPSPSPGPVSSSPSPLPSPREVVSDPALALSGHVGDPAYSRMLRLREVRVVPGRGALALEAVAEMEPSRYEAGRQAWALGVDAGRTALVLPGGEWLLVRVVSGVALVRDGELIVQSPPWVPGVVRRLRLEFPVPPAGTERVQVVVAWLTRSYQYGGVWQSSGERVAELRLR